MIAYAPSSVTVRPGPAAGGGHRRQPDPGHGRGPGGRGPAGRRPAAPRPVRGGGRRLVRDAPGAVRPGRPGRRDDPGRLRVVPGGAGPGGHDGGRRGRPRLPEHRQPRLLPRAVRRPPAAAAPPAEGAAAGGSGHPGERSSLPEPATNIAPALSTAARYSWLAAAFSAAVWAAAASSWMLIHVSCPNGPSSAKNADGVPVTDSKLVSDLDAPGHGRPDLAERCGRRNDSAIAPIGEGSPVGSEVACTRVRSESSNPPRSNSWPSSARSRKP